MQPPTRVINSTVNLDVIVRARFLLLHLELDERQLNVSTARRLNHPLAVGVRLVSLIAEPRVRINILHLIRGLQVTAAHRRVRRKESLSMNTRIGVEQHEHGVGGR